MERHVNMNCKPVEEALLDLANPGAQPAPEVQAHLRDCPQCAAKLAELRQTWSALDSWKAPEPSQYFSSRLQARFREERANPQPSGILGWFGVRWQPALAAALAIVLMVAISVYRLNPPVEPGATNTPIATSPAVADLQNLDKNGDVYDNFDMLYDDDDQTSNQ